MKPVTLKIETVAIVKRECAQKVIEALGPGALLTDLEDPEEGWTGVAIIKGENE